MVNTVFQFKAVKPKQLSIASVRGNILNALLDERKYAISLLNQTVETWNNKPTMIGDIAYKGGDVMMIAGPSGDNEVVKHWYYLDNGTHVRYAKLSRDWQSKTTPGSLRSGAGKGEVLKRGYKAGGWMGITAREWTKTINKKMKPGFQRKIQAAVTRGIQAK